MSHDVAYLDHNATTPLDPAALEALLPWLQEGYGNPSSTHSVGQRAARAVAKARAQTTQLLGAASPREVVFTSGGTESINAAIVAGLRARPDRRRIVTSTVEHSAALQPAKRLAEEGYDVVFVAVDGEGRLDVDAACAAIDETCAVASLLWGNNETGALMSDEAIERIGARCREAGAAFALDAVQVAGKVPLRAAERTVDYLSISAHKFHGPKGVGALWVRTGLDCCPHVEGGTQEEGRRGGTVNVAGVVGLGAAAALAHAHATDDAARARLAGLRDRLEQGILERVPEARAHATGGARVPNTTNIGFPGLAGDAILLLLSELGVCVSTGSACSSGKKSPSRVLSAMGIDDDEAAASIRFSLSRMSTDADVDRALEAVPEAISQLKSLAPAG